MVTREVPLILVSSVFLIITNAALVIGLKRTNKNLTLSQKLYIYLSLTDGVVGIVYMPYMAIMIFSSIDFCTAQSISMAISIYTSGISLGTFAVISVLRNIAIRKPFYKVKKSIIYGVLGAWNGVSLITSMTTFLTYNPRYTSYTLYCCYWLYIGSLLSIEVLISIALNLWSKRVLTKQVQNDDHENETKKIKRKRNQKAVGILNFLSLVYTICTFPMGCYYIFLGALLLTYEGNEIMFDNAYDLFSFFHIPSFLSSGLNALVYMLKDKDIIILAEFVARGIREDKRGK